jgi:hypothetical protein
VNDVTYSQNCVILPDIKVLTFNGYIFISSWELYRMGIGAELEKAEKK